MALTVSDIMDADPVTVRPDETALRLMRVIVDRGHNRLAVTEHGRLVGVVTRVDVLDALTREA